jgi:hypothetical protein
MAELGEQVERTSAILGTSTKDVQELGFIAKATGTNQETLARSMERFQVSLEKAQNGTSLQAQALHAFGLSAKDLIGLPLPEQMDKFADAVSRFADSPSKTAAIGTLSRGLVELIPILDQGSSGLDKLRESADGSAVMSHATVEALGGLNRALSELKASFLGVTGTIVGSFAPALTRAITGTNELINSVNVAVQTHTVWEREMIALSTVAAQLSQAMANLGTMAKDVFTLNWGAIAADRQAGMDRIAALQKEGEEKMNEVARGAMAEYKKILEGEGEGAEKPQVPAIDVGTKDRLSDQTKAIQQAIQTQNEVYQSQVEQINSAAKTYQLSEGEKTAALIAAVRTRVAAVESEIRQEIALYQANGKEYAALQAELIKIAQKGSQDIQKFQDQALQQNVKDWQNALAPIQAAFDSQLKKILSGTETFGQAMKNIFADLVLNIISGLEKIALDKAALGLGGSVGGTGGSGGSGEGLAGLLVGGISKLLGGLIAFDVGTPYVPNDMVAMIHQGEAILPNNLMADAFRSGQLGGGGGGASVAINGPVIGSQAFAQQFTRLLANTLRQNQQLSPSSAW